MTTKRNHQELEKRRLQAARLFAKGDAPAEVAKRLGVVRQAAYRWKWAWEAGGKAGLASKGKAGRKARLTQGDVLKLTEALLAGPRSQGYKTELWTLPRVSVLIRKLTGVSYHPGHIWRVLRALGFSCQRPERRALERNEQAIGRWKRRQWPAQKKKPASSAARSSSWTKAA